MIVNGNIELLDGSPGWRKASTFHTGGTLSNDNKTFTPPAGGYTTVVYNRTFSAALSNQDTAEEFRLVAYWAHNYIGAGFVYGPSVHHFDFNGYSADGYGPYAGALNTSGFPNGYNGTFFGQYHAPISGGGGSAPGYWIKWERVVNSLTLQYSTISADGPWTNFTNSYYTEIAWSDAVCVICGEAGDSGTPLTIVDNYATLRQSGHFGRIVFGFDRDLYRYSLNLIRGYIGGGYIGGTIYSQVTKIAFATDTWTTMSNNMNKAIKYGGWASSLTNGYAFHNVQNSDVTNDRINFPTDSVQAIANRPNGASSSPSSSQQGVGFLPASLPNSQGGTYNTTASYGLKAYEHGKGGAMDILTFNTETWTSSTGAPVGQYGVGWFNKDYSFQFASQNNNTVTNRMGHATETWGTIVTTNSPGSLGLPGGGAEKGVNSKHEKFFLAGNWGGSYCTTTAGNNIFKFDMVTSTWTLSTTAAQTLYNNEQAGVMGMNWGYFAGGYNCNSGQNAHTDKINYNVETVVNISDAPRQLSSASPMWSSY